MQSHDVASSACGVALMAPQEPLLPINYNQKALSYNSKTIAIFYNRP